MKAIAALFDIIPGWLYAVICASLFIWGGVQTWQLDRVHGQIKTIKLQQAEAVAAAEKAVREESDRLQRVKDEAIAEAEKRAFANANAARAAQSELARLRNALTKIPPGSSDAACKAIADRAATVSTVFGECSTELVEMGRRADAHASDLRTFYDAWPANADFQKRLDAFTQQLKGQTK